MITLKMISEKISAWIRNREAARERSPFMSCALFASLAPISKTSFGSRSTGVPIR
jgi:hypothetical protein